MRLGVRTDDDEDLALSAILTDYKTTFSGPTVVYLTDAIGDRLEVEHGLPSARYAGALRRLIQAGALTGRQIIGAPTRWTIQVPAQTWQRYLAATGVDVDAVAGRMLERVRSATSAADLKLEGFEGFDFWTVNAIAARLQSLGLMKFHTTTDGGITVSWVKERTAA